MSALRIPKYKIVQQCNPQLNTYSYKIKPVAEQLRKTTGSMNYQQRLDPRAAVTEARFLMLAASGGMG